MRVITHVNNVRIHCAARPRYRLHRIYIGQCGIGHGVTHGGGIHTAALITAGGPITIGPCQIEHPPAPVGALRRHCGCLDEQRSIAMVQQLGFQHLLVGRIGMTTVRDMIDIVLCALLRRRVTETVAMQGFNQSAVLAAIINVTRHPVGVCMPGEVHIDFRLIEQCA